MESNSFKNQNYSLIKNNTLIFKADI